MSEKTLSWRLFRWGGVPRRLRPTLEAEGISLLEEGLPGRFIARDFKAPGKRYRYRWEGFSGCLVITGKRLLLCSYWRVQINIGLDDSRRAAIRVALRDQDWLTIWFESADFHDDWRGVLELRLKTVRAREIEQQLRALGLTPGLPPA